MKTLKKYLVPLIFIAVFETIAVALWLANNNLFYLFNFTYIGVSIALGIFLYIREYKHARRVVQLLVGLYILVYLGLICNENMQIEGFWYYLFTGVFEAATIHYAVAKIFGPLLFGRGWCGYACWTAMVLDFLPWKAPQHERRKIGWIRYVTFAASLRRHRPGVRLQGQQGILQVYLSRYGIPEAHELFLPAEDQMRQGQMRLLREMQKSLSDGC